MAKSNYEITRDRVRGSFLQYDQTKMIQKFGLRHDENTLSIELMAREHHIDRKTGVITWSDDGFLTCTEADFDSSLTICDVLCDSKPDCHLSGRYCTLSMLRGTVKSGGPGLELFQPAADAFDGHLSALRAACARFGTPITLSGDAAFLLKPFPFLPTILQFWQSEEDFPANLKFMFDENITDFIRYETIFYLTSHIIHRLRETIMAESAR